MTLEDALCRGFDKSSAYVDDDGDAMIHIRCSQCYALVVNGVPCHEPSCPNIVHFNDQYDNDRW